MGNVINKFIMQNIYTLSRKVHRFLVVIITVLILIMSVTGTFLKYYNFADSIGVDLELARKVHNVVSLYFTLALVLMLITGLVMYIYPWYVKRRRGKLGENENTSIDIDI